MAATIVIIFIGGRGTGGGTWEGTCLLRSTKNIKVLFWSIGFSCLCIKDVRMLPEVAHSPRSSLLNTNPSKYHTLTSFVARFVNCFQTNTSADRPKSANVPNTTRHPTGHHKQTPSAHPDRCGGDKQLFDCCSTLVDDAALQHTFTHFGGWPGGSGRDS
jgi:hypothetical protein